MAFRRDKVRLECADVLLDRISRPAQAHDLLLLKEVKQSVDDELKKMPFNMQLWFQLSRFEDIDRLAAEPV